MNTTKTLDPCNFCGRWVLEELRDRGCAMHGVDRQISILFPFLTINKLETIKHKGDDIIRFEINYIRHEDKS